MNLVKSAESLLSTSLQVHDLCGSSRRTWQSCPSDFSTQNLSCCPSGHDNSNPNVHQNRAGQSMPRGEDSPVLQALSILPSATVEMNPRRTMAGRLLHGVQLVSSIGSHPLWNLIDSEIPLKFLPFRFRKVAMKKSSRCKFSESYYLLPPKPYGTILPNDAYGHQCYHGCLHEIVFGIIKLGSTRLQQSFQPDAKLSSCQAIIICGFG